MSCLINLITWIYNFNQEIKSDQHWCEGAPVSLNNESIGCCPPVITGTTERKSTLDFNSHGQTPPRRPAHTRSDHVTVSLGRVSRRRDTRGRRLWQGAASDSSALGVREPHPNGRPGRMTAYPSSSTPSMIDHIMPSQLLWILVQTSVT